MSDTLDNNNVVNENTEAQNSGVNMTQEQLNELINKKYASGAEKAKAELLNSLGVESIDSLKSIIDERKAQEEANKSELQKMQEQLQNIQAEKEQIAKEAQVAKQKAEINALSAKHGITDVEVFEIMYENASKAEGFDSEGYVNSLRDTKPYLFGQNAPKTKTDTSSNNNQNPLNKQTLAEQAKELVKQGKISEARKLLDQAHKI